MIAHRFALFSLAAALPLLGATLAQAHEYNSPYSPRYEDERPELSPRSINIHLSPNSNRAAREAVLKADDELARLVGLGRIRTSDLLIGRADLNSDGYKDILVYNKSSFACRDGLCPLSVYQYRPGRPLRVLMADYYTTPDVVVSYSTNRGWYDLVLQQGYRQSMTISYNGSGYGGWLPEPVRPPRYDHDDDWRNHERWERHRPHPVFEDKPWGRSKHHRYE